MNVGISVGSTSTPITNIPINQPVPARGVCPGCGRCRDCGHGATPYQPYPNPRAPYPYDGPWHGVIPPGPVITYC